LRFRITSRRGFLVALINLKERLAAVGSGHEFSKISIRWRFNRFLDGSAQLLQVVATQPNLAQ
jgi:hypothetical protein